MTDYYDRCFNEYFKKTFLIDPTSFLSDFTKYLKPGFKILDVGCGSGRDLLWLKRLGFTVTGFERSYGLVDLARKNTNCPVIQGDFESYDFSGLSVDALILSGALVHIHHNRLKPVLENINKSLKLNGYMYISLKQGAGTVTDCKNRTFYLWQDNDLKMIFQELGLSIISLTQSSSAMGTGEIWLGYILEKIHKS